MRWHPSADALTRRRDAPVLPRRLNPWPWTPRGVGAPRDHRRAVPVSLRLVAPSLLLTILATAAGAQDDTPLVFTPTAVILGAVAGNPRLQAAEQAVAQSRGVARAAGALPGAQITASPIYTDVRQLDVDAEISQTILEPTRRPATRAAQAGTQLALLELESLRLEIMADARYGYVRLQAAERTAAAQAADVALLEALRDAAARARDAGERPGADVLRAELELSRASQSQAASQAAVELARARLNALLGRPAEAPLVLAATTATPTDVPVPAELLARLGELPRLRQAAMVVERQRREIDLARSQRGPTLEVAGFREDEEHGVRLSLSLPLFDHGRIRGEVEAAEAAVQEAEHEREVVRRDVTSAVEQAHLALVAAVALHQSYSDEILARAARLAELAQVGYGIGETSMLEVLDARRQLVQARLEAVEVELAVDEAWVDLASSVGALTDWLPAVAAADTVAAKTIEPAPSRVSRVFGPPAPTAVITPLTSPGSAP